ncbi:EamA family transporter [Streptomyces sp. NPDC048419]|uniref:EamA family transporter n=1 Tax=Streptomyces sp. NPDC048419 TaxID=3365547 RepID=UPI003719552F
MRRSMLLCVAGAVSVSAFQISIIFSVRQAGVCAGTLMSIGTGSVCTGAVSVLRDRTLPPGWLASAILSACGCSLLASSTHSRIETFGVLASFIAGLAYAAYTIAAKTLVSRGEDGTTVMSAFFTWSTILLSPTLSGTQWHEILSIRGAIAIGWLGIAATAGAYFLFSRGLPRVSAPHATLVGLAEPVTASLLALIILQERMNMWSILGISAMLISFCLAAFSNFGFSGKFKRFIDR